MQFSVPQFIEEEDKVFGPFTLKQFIYVAGAGGIGFMLYSLLPFFLAILIMIPVGFLAFMLAFKPVHGRSFAQVLESAFKFVLGSKLYLWRKDYKKTSEKEKTKKIQMGGRENEELNKIPKVTEGRLDSLSMNLGTNKNTGV